MVASMQSEVYHSTRREQRERNCQILPGRVSRTIRSDAKKQVMSRWKAWIEETTAGGRRTVKSILPMMDSWVLRKWGNLTYRATQVLTGHSCFGQFLYRIGRDPILACHHCPNQLDSAQHTLAECVAWDQES